MTEALGTSDRIPPTDGPPEVSRLAAAALARVERCSCSGPASVVVLRGFDRASRERAAEVADALSGHDPGMVVSIRAVPLLAAFGREVQHRCAVVDVTGRAHRGALLGWRWEPASTAGGARATDQLAVRVLGREEVVLQPGHGLLVSPAADRLELRPSGPGAAVDLPGGTEVLVRQVEGRHLLHRDEVPVEDAATPVTIVLTSPGIARRTG